jgi:arylsulfatase A-like enzyme
MGDTMKGKPNILLLLPDALRADVLDPSHICQTPNIDRICARGVRFTRAYTPSPTCSPARSSLMTGLLPHNHGVLQVDHCVDSDQSVLRKEKPHWAQRLVSAGFRTGYFGKWHVESRWELNDFGWEVGVADACRYPQAFNQAMHEHAVQLEDNLDEGRSRRIQGASGYRPFLWYGVSAEHVDPDRLPESVPFRLAHGYLDERLGGDDPWCVCISLSQPNDELLAEKELFERYDLSKIPLPPNLADDLADRPGFYRRYQEIWKGLSADDWQRARACYYARVTAIDTLFGRLIERIDKAGELDNTIVIVTSDHGRLLGDHGLDSHNFTAFEASYNIPLVVAGPGIERGAVSRARVGLHDLCPTILELSGAQPIGVPDSSSFASLLSEPATQSRRLATGYAENFGTRFPQMQRVYWDGEWKYVFNGIDYDEMYKLDDDPHELKNLAGHNSHRERAESMMRAIWNRIIATGDTTLAHSHYLTMQLGIVGPDQSDAETLTPDR